MLNGKSNNLESKCSKQQNSFFFKTFLEFYTSFILITGLRTLGYFSPVKLGI